jgi:hypothetical protein
MRPEPTAYKEQLPTSLSQRHFLLWNHCKVLWFSDLSPPIPESAFLATPPENALFIGKALNPSNLELCYII